MEHDEAFFCLFAKLSSFKGVFKKIHFPIVIHSSLVYFCFHAGLFTLLVEDFGEYKHIKRPLSMLNCKINQLVARRHSSEKAIALKSKLNSFSLSPSVFSLIPVLKILGIWFYEDRSQSSQRKCWPSSGNDTKMSG